MKISELIKKVQPAFSFEFFPPKDETGFDQLFNTIHELKAHNPAYVSVTYGAGGSTRSKTLELVARIKKEIGLESMAHLTCVGSAREEIREILESLKKSGVDNVLALRGDPPKGETEFVKPQDGFGFANELVEFTHQNFDFSIGVAGYPEKHVECSDMSTDLDNLQRKIDAGGEFIVTQLFFDNRFYFEFVESLRKRGINVPVIAGIMPIQSFKQILRFTKMCGATIPKHLLDRLEKEQDNPEGIKAIGVAHALEQCEELLANGAPGVHFYTLNRSNATRQILEGLNHTTYPSSD